MDAAAAAATDPRGRLSRRLRSWPPLGFPCPRHGDPPRAVQRFHHVGSLDSPEQGSPPPSRRPLEEIVVMSRFLQLGKSDRKIAQAVLVNS
ncbi:uncharacterized protein [Triticum aestivum]|uniref:uncharacterized protein isoform X2 n=1 Tax=Triticum aestivum TaxID=4565 RepID=UPI001D00BB52|nr:uncharacterized protein LOC123177036 isoform X2 [Triticum aestivum]